MSSAAVVPVTNDVDAADYDNDDVRSFGSKVPKPLFDDISDEEDSLDKMPVTETKMKPVPNTPAIVTPEPTTAAVTPFVSAPVPTSTTIPQQQQQRQTDKKTKQYDLSVTVTVENGDFNTMKIDRMELVLRRELFRLQNNQNTPPASFSLPETNNASSQTTNDASPQSTNEASSQTVIEPPLPPPMARNEPATSSDDSSLVDVPLDNPVVTPVQQKPIAKKSGWWGRAGGGGATRRMRKGSRYYTARFMQDVSRQQQQQQQKRR